MAPQSPRDDVGREEGDIDRDQEVEGVDGVAGGCALGLARSSAAVRRARCLLNQPLADSDRLEADWLADPADPKLAAYTTPLDMLFGHPPGSEVVRQFPPRGQSSTFKDTAVAAIGNCKSVRPDSPSCPDPAIITSSAVITKATRAVEQSSSADSITPKKASCTTGADPSSQMSLTPSGVVAPIIHTVKIERADERDPASQWNTTRRVTLEEGSPGCRSQCAPAFSPRQSNDPARTSPVGPRSAARPDDRVIPIGCAKQIRAGLGAIRVQETIRSLESYLHQYVRISALPPFWRDRHFSAGTKWQAQEAFELGRAQLVIEGLMYLSDILYVLLLTLRAFGAVSTAR